MADPTPQEQLEKLVTLMPALTQVITSALGEKFDFTLLVRLNADEKLAFGGNIHIKHAIDMARAWIDVAGNMDRGQHFVSTNCWACDSEKELCKTEGTPRFVLLCTECTKKLKRIN